MRTNVATSVGDRDQRHAQHSAVSPMVHVSPGARSADPLILLSIHDGVNVRLTLSLAAAERLYADLGRAIDYHHEVTR